MYQLFLEKLKNQKRNRPFALFTDLDDTFINKYYPTPQERQGLTQKDADLIIDQNIRSYQDSISLYRFLHSQSIPFSFVSGRDIYMFKALQQVFKTKLPSLSYLITPYILAGAVGTEIWVLQQDGQYIYDGEYEKHLQTKFGYERLKIYELTRKLINSIAKIHPQTDFKFQKRDVLPASPHEFPPQKMKVSLEFVSSSEMSVEIQGEINTFFASHNLDKIRVITSYGFPINEKINSYNVDLLPCGKAEPVNYIAEQFNISPICAGDGGNDEDMIINAKGYAIVVGGYKKELEGAIQSCETKKAIFIESNPAYKGPLSLENALKNFLLRSP